MQANGHSINRISGVAQDAHLLVGQAQGARQNDSAESRTSPNRTSDLQAQMRALSEMASNSWSSQHALTSPRSPDAVSEPRVSEDGAEVALEVQGIGVAEPVREVNRRGDQRIRSKSFENVLMQRRLRDLSEFSTVISWCSENPFNSPRSSDAVTEPRFSEDLAADISIQAQPEIQDAPIQTQPEIQNTQDEAHVAEQAHAGTQTLDPRFAGWARLTPAHAQQVAAQFERINAARRAPLPRVNPPQNREERADSVDSLFNEGRSPCKAIMEKICCGRRIQEDRSPATELSRRCRQLGVAFGVLGIVGAVVALTVGFLNRKNGDEFGITAFVMTGVGVGVFCLGVGVSCFARKIDQRYMDEDEMETPWRPNRTVRNRELVQNQNPIFIV